jgi:peptide deformylase
MKLDNTILKNVCTEVKFDKPKQNLKLAQQLFQLMLKENGIGLASNQVGIDSRVFVMLINDKIYHCFNPIILESIDDDMYYTEGCLSFPGERLQISRPNKIQVKYQNAYGIETVEWLDGLASRCFQHELDHLNGITMHDRYKDLGA